MLRYFASSNSSSLKSWTKFYEFNSVDIRAAASIVDHFFASSASSSLTSAIWPTVRGLLGSAIYGGRIDNPFDFSVLETLLNHIFSDSTLNSRQLGSLKLPNSTDLKVPLPFSRLVFQYIISSLKI